ncbi:MAG: hypothetical protein JWN70_4271 [Planctomycetaceae bacterium]|nr:hypothetical protein [Planctomycetaceae bacterium]
MWFSPASSAVALNDAYFIQRGSELLASQKIPARRGLPPRAKQDNSLTLAVALFVVASVFLLAAGLADSLWQARRLSEMLGWPGVCILAASIATFIYASRFSKVVTITPLTGPGKKSFNCQSNA